MYAGHSLHLERVCVGADAEIGENSCALFGSTINVGAQLKANSLLLRGDEIPAYNVWSGVPSSLSSAYHDTTHPRIKSVFVYVCVLVFWFHLFLKSPATDVLHHAHNFFPTVVTFGQIFSLIAIKQDVTGI